MILGHRYQCIAYIAALCASVASASVEQIHLSFTENSTAFAIEFVSTSETCEVEYYDVSNSGATSTATTQTEFVDSIGYLHRGVLTSLNPASHYQYRVNEGTGNSTAWTNFKTMPFSKSGGRAAVFADFGLRNDVSMGHLIQDFQEGNVDYFVHAGDIAYNLMDNNSEVGNIFLRTVSDGFAKSAPYMVAPGNHESHDNFTQYNQRFRALADSFASNGRPGGNFFYSYTVGLIHYVVIDTELFKFPNQTKNSKYPFTAQQQLDWLEQDLAAANLLRDTVPWVVMLGHKGWYMDNFGTESEPDTLNTNFTGFDDLACRYGVDLYLTGHVHIYQRFLPLLGPSSLRLLAPPRDVDYDCASEDGHTYEDPRYMPTIVVASPGDQEVSARIQCGGIDVASHIAWQNAQAVCTADYGYGHLEAVNATHLRWEFKQTGQAPNAKDHVQGNVAKPLPFTVTRDHLWLVQHNHGPRSYCDT
jgi:predicted phosphodiesterase